MSGTGQQMDRTDDTLFGRLLAFLDRDGDTAGLTPEQIREQQGARYETIRRKQIRLFAWRGAPDPELLADRTFDRVMEKVQEIEDGFRGDPSHYIASVGRLIFLESLRELKRAAPPPEPDRSARKERTLDCLDHCMDELLSPEDQEFILSYFRGEKASKIQHRQRLAAKAGSANAVRIRVCRIKKRLQPCVTECVERNESAEIGIVE